MDETTGAEAPTVTYATFLEAGELRLQVCDDCRRQVFPPRVLCPGCGSTELTWEAAGDTATVYSSTVVRQRPDRGGDYNIAIVEFDGGARMLSAVDDVAPGSVTIGSRVTPGIVEQDGDRLVRFTPADEVTA